MPLEIPVLLLHEIGGALALKHKREDERRHHQPDGERARNRYDGESGEYRAHKKDAGPDTGDDAVQGDEGGIVPVLPRIGQPRHVGREGPPYQDGYGSDEQQCSEAERARIVGRRCVSDEEDRERCPGEEDKGSCFKQTVGMGP